MAIIFDRAIPTFRMFDIAKALEFYIGYLGFKVDFEHRFEPALPLFLGISRGGLRLFLSEHHGDGSPGANVTVEMTGVAEFHAELAAKGYNYLRPGLERQPWNVTTMTVIDPFSNRIIFSEENTPS